MSDYDFKTLNDKEFEIFCSDLLGAHLHQRFERFKAGKDLGVDGRFFTSSGAEVILQCKHWANTPTAQLIGALRDKERPKLDKIKPTAYILAVSNKLSRSEKQIIASFMSPYLKSEADIYGCEDLNDILKRHKLIERNHYKLWMSSTEVLSSIFSNSIIGRSKDELTEIEDRFQTYVVTSHHERAIRKLEESHVLIVTGEPGIGKTTLAGQICLDYVAKGFDFANIGDDITEAEAIFDQDSKQIFFFDDFLGRNYLEALSGHEGGKVTGFIKRISKNLNKRFVLTSRSTILNQGKLLIDLLRDRKTERNEYELNIRSLTEMDKAQILYNHIWFSKLDESYIDVIYENERYLEIIRHQNFNPRLISYLTDPDRLGEIIPARYWDYVTYSLANPAQIWENPFDAQQDDFTRALIVLVAFNGRRIAESDLSNAYYNYIARPENRSLTGRQDFHFNLKFLTGSFLNRYIHSKNEALFDLFNPSIGDFVLRRHLTNKPILKMVFLSLTNFDGLLSFERLCNDNKINDADAQDIATAIFKLAHETHYGNHSFTYILQLFAFSSIRWGDAPGFKPFLTNSFKYLWENLDNVPMTENLISAVRWATSAGELDPSNATEFLEKNFGVITQDGEILQAWKLLESIELDEVTRRELYEKFGENIAEMIADNISDFVDTTDAFNQCNYGDYEDAKSKLKSMVSDKLNDLGVPDGLVDGEAIVDDYDIRYDMDRFFQNSYEPRYDNQTSSASTIPSGDSAIHDLFDRS